ncbi:GNAT family N-acetyltransferase [Methylobacterium terricola]|uniref:GNAT family N-acetyltransferase n=1 Tax=Methylobacterium terricola TaxID=2583531 RepID=A0A5C4L685_9HYPH|nr:GNAT family N-acetyltransferase [Methylobacterium terricola]TNC06259.1 GNAT family N-acetyltransferase [Methylobacterium terricola]
MPAMVDPTDGLTSFQEMFKRKIIDVKPCSTDRKLFLHGDQPAPGVMRLSYVRLQGRTVTAFVSFTPAEFIEGRPCFQAGVAVPQTHRGQGRAKEIVRAAIAEMRAGFSRAGIAPFWIEAIIHANNIASQRVAEATISPNRINVVDGNSGDNAFQYLMKVEKSE